MNPGIPDKKIGFMPLPTAFPRYRFSTMSPTHWFSKAAMTVTKQKKSPLKDAFKKTYTRFLKIRGNPKEIALGLSMGLVVGMTPFIGLHTAPAVFLAALFKWNQISAAIGVWISNPFTAPFVYSLTYFVGKFAIGIQKAPQLHTDLSYTIILSMLQQTPEVLLILVVGGIILGLPLPLLGYYFSYSAVSRYQEDIRSKLAKRRERSAKKKKDKPKARLIAKKKPRSRRKKVRVS